MREICSVDDVVEFEQGDMSPERMVRFFAGLVESGMAWKLQGSYGRQAAALIEQGWIDREGNVLKDITQEVE